MFGARSWGHRPSWHCRCAAGLLFTGINQAWQSVCANFVLLTPARHRNPLCYSAQCTLKRYLKRTKASWPARHASRARTSISPTQLPACRQFLPAMQIAACAGCYHRCGRVPRGAARECQHQLAMSLHPSSQVFATNAASSPKMQTL